MIELLELALFNVSGLDPESDSLLGLALRGVSGNKLLASSVILGLSLW